MPLPPLSTPATACPPLRLEVPFPTLLGRERAASQMCRTSAHLAAWRTCWCARRTARHWSRTPGSASLWATLRARRHGGSETLLRGDSSSRRMQCLMSAASLATRPLSMSLACPSTRWTSLVTLRRLTSRQRTSLRRQSCRIRGEMTGMILHLLRLLCRLLPLRVNTNALQLRLNAPLALLHLLRLPRSSLSHLLLLRLLLPLRAHLCAHPFTSRQRDMAASGHTLHWLANISLLALPASRVPSATRSLSAAMLCPSDSALAFLPLLRRQSPQSAATPPSDTLLHQTLSSTHQSSQSLRLRLRLRLHLPPQLRLRLLPPQMTNSTFWQRVMRTSMSAHWRPCSLASRMSTAPSGTTTSPTTTHWPLPLSL
ncbi:hypothetical protein PYCCODRAFT_1530298 [Trametes coccinea BRFM310]|uniref:Uncharacterized protein n=1 Tax=Trametes coccinea (strain BRFM310) TaxID=1353009 RepID=A0A1Y2IX57_TRAC3|nr:hypothetical protein PYCCODRAFT_1530296 [Trametes coccinea BRFM310]OSD05736.1 hypothetical protein PYCCODRAFT_1530298 [Trametes coccinea BRFM310]